MRDEADGVIEIAFAQRSGRSVAEHAYSAGNSRLSSLLPNVEGAPYLMTITTGGGFVEGERYRVDISAGKGARGMVASQAPTYVYKCDRGGHVEQTMRITADDNAFLELYWDEAIPYRTARFRQRTRIDLAPRATLVMTDGLTSGWSPDGRAFQYDQVSMHTRIFRAGRLVCNDHVICEPRVHTMDGLGFFEGYGVFSSCTIIDAAIDGSFVDAARVAVRARAGADAAGVRWGISLLAEGGVVMRVLGNEAQHNRRVIEALVNYFRDQVKHLPPITLRKNAFCTSPC